MAKQAAMTRARSELHDISVYKPGDTVRISCFHYLCRSFFLATLGFELAPIQNYKGYGRFILTQAVPARFFRLGSSHLCKCGNWIDRVAIYPAIDGEGFVIVGINIDSILE